MLEISSFLSLPDKMVVTSATSTDEGICIHLRMTTQTSGCPLCHQEATHIRSYYSRVVADLPCAGQRIHLLLQVRKFRCDTLCCPRKVFAERLGTFVSAWARKTTRLRQAIASIGLATCGNSGARLAGRLAMTASPCTVLRYVMTLPLPTSVSVTHLGIDDFALCRGRNYGTVLVDLLRHQAIDLLPDRKAETAQAWIALHPEINLISRDRASDYATAASQGAPQAIQTADRFHLCKNLTDAIQKVLARCHGTLREQQKRPEPSPETGEACGPCLVTADGHPYSAHQRQRADRYQQVVALHEQGATRKEIAKRVGVGMRTIQRWLSAETYVETHYHYRHRSPFRAFEPYVRRRWEEGCHNIQQIWREIKALGYPHSARALRAHLGARRITTVADLPEAGVLDHFSAKQAVWLFVRPLEDLSAKDQGELAALREASDRVETMYHLVQDFFRIVHTRDGAHLDDWIASVATSAIPELQRFAAGLERDKAAVVAGLTLGYSNGQTEGQVTRIKLIKRMMFGRAGFPLLRQRVLNAL